MKWIVILGPLTLTAFGQPYTAPDANPPIIATVSWDAAPAAAGYNLYLGTNSGQYFSRTSISNVTSYELTNLAAGLTYYVALTTVSSNGLQSRFSNEANVATPAPPPPPGGVKIVIKVEKATAATGPWNSIAETALVDNTPGFWRSRLEIAPASAPISARANRNIQPPPMPHK